VRSELTIGLHRAGNGAVVARGALAVTPFWCRWDGETLWLVSSAAAPVGDDVISLEVEVGEGVRATVRSVAATVVYAARGEGTELHTTVRVGEGATLRWQPEPVIVTARARHRSRTVVDVADGGGVLFDELVVMGRSDEAPGSFAGTLELRMGGSTASLTSFDTTTPGWHGPGGMGDAKVVGTRAVVDPLELLAPDAAATRSPVTPSTVVLRPDAGGAIVTTLATNPTSATAQLDAALVLGAG
jgi:urease accessory protein